jgi:hypothetical protein
MHEQVDDLKGKTGGKSMRSYPSYGNTIHRRAYAADKAGRPQFSILHHCMHLSAYWLIR